MAIILCDKCGHAMLDKDIKCPNCGTEVVKQAKPSKKLNFNPKYLWYLGGVVAAIVVIAIVVSLASSDNTTNSEIVQDNTQNPIYQSEEPWNVVTDSSSVDDIKYALAKLRAVYFRYEHNDYPYPEQQQFAQKEVYMMSADMRLSMVLHYRQGEGAPSIMEKLKASETPWELVSEKNCSEDVKYAYDALAEQKRTFEGTDDEWRAKYKEYANNLSSILAYRHVEYNSLGLFF